jgi:hypothetical protein
MVGLMIVLPLNQPVLKYDGVSLEDMILLNHIIIYITNLGYGDILQFILDFLKINLISYPLHPRPKGRCLSAERG